MAVTAAGTSTMARKSLPNIEPLPAMPQTANVLQAGTQTSVASTVSSSSVPTQSTTVTATVASVPITSVASTTPKMVEVVVVNTDSSDSRKPQPDPKPLINAVEKQDFKLSEIISQERKQLFQQDSGLELEPPRIDVYTVRRRSRQFFTLREEEENENAKPVDNCKYSVEIGLSNVGLSQTLTCLGLFFFLFLKKRL